MGLGAMYMMHLLAQDFNRIRRPIQNAVRAFIYKRDVMAQNYKLRPPLPLHHEPVTVSAIYARPDTRMIVQSNVLSLRIPCASLTELRSIGIASCKTIR